MADDSFTVTSNQSWFSRLGGAIAGVLFGIVLFLAAFPFLTWNEGRAIHRAKTLETGSKAVISVPATPVDAANEGKLVHVTGNVAAGGPVSDPRFAVSAPGILLQRNVEMYQWIEDKKSETKQKIGGGEETVTTYTYAKKWSSDVIDSSDFQKPEGHENPTEMPAPSKTFTASDVTLGAYTLPSDLIEKIDNFTPLSLPADQALPTGFSAPAHRTSDGFYLGTDPATPAVGDARVKFEVALPGPISVIARQVQHTFEPYSVARLGTIELLQIGTVSADSMFQAEAQANTILTWLLRLAGFLMMFFGLMLISRPLSVVASVLPFLGDLMSAGAGLIALIVALPLTITTIAIAWIAYRPLIGIPLLVVAGVSIFIAARSLPRKPVKAAA